MKAHIQSLILESASDGQSLSELVIVIVLVGIVSLVFAGILIQAAQSYSDVDETENALQDCRMASERMTKEIRTIKNRSSYKEATVTSLYFKTVAGDSIKFYWNGSQGGDLMMQKNLVSNVLASSVDSLGFSYFDSTGAAAGATTSIWRIQFSLELAHGDKNVRMRNSVYVRNH